MQEQRLYVIGRADLAPGLRAAQATHAAFAFALKYPSTTEAWHPGYLILLEVADERSLVHLLRVADRLNLESASFLEPDLDYELTAVAIGPTPLARQLCAGIDLMFATHASPVTMPGCATRSATVRPVAEAPYSGSSTARATVSNTADAGSNPVPGSSPYEMLDGGETR